MPLKTFPFIRDSNGGLVAIEFKDLPFKPKRVYYIFDVNGLRGGHAHRKEKEFFVCIRGDFRIKIHDGKRFKIWNMKRPGHAVYVPNMVWHEFDKFSRDAVMLALSSTPYEGRKGYIMDFENFLSLCRKKS